jgi:methionyl-tRNA formyltransferase
MSIVILTDRGIEHRFVTRAIVSAFGDDVTAVIICDTPPETVTQQIRRYRRRYSYRQCASRVVARSYRMLTRADQHFDNRLREVLFPDGDTNDFDRPDLVRTVQSHNGAAALELLDELHPKVIAVYGTKIIRPPVIRKAQLGIYNMHTGVSPRYRGSDTIFWPLHNAEPEWVGVTIHQLDEGIDSGPIERIGRPQIEATDDEATLFAKCVAVGADLYVDVLRDALEGRASGEPQQLETGRNYLRVERTLLAELRTRRLLRNGLLAGGSR